MPFLPNHQVSGKMAIALPGPWGSGSTHRVDSAALQPVLRGPGALQLTGHGVLWATPPWSQVPTMGRAGWAGAKVCVLGEVALDTLDVQRLSGCEKET